MKYVKSEPHPVKRLLSPEERDAKVKSLPVEQRFIRRLLAMCADCSESVAVDKLGKYRHVA